METESCGGKHKSQSVPLLGPPHPTPTLSSCCGEPPRPRAPLENSHVASGWAEAPGLRADYFTLPCAPWAVAHPHSSACKVSPAARQFSVAVIIFPSSSARSLVTFFFLFLCRVSCHFFFFPGLRFCQNSLSESQAASVETPD